MSRMPRRQSRKCWLLSNLCANAASGSELPDHTQHSKKTRLGGADEGALMRYSDLRDFDKAGDLQQSKSADPARRGSTDTPSASRRTEVVQLPCSRLWLRRVIATCASITPVRGRSRQ